MPSRTPPPQKKRLVVRPDRLARERDALPAEVLQLLRLCDGTRSLKALERESRMGPRMFERVVRKLATLGLVELAAEPGSYRERLLAWASDVGRPWLEDSATTTHSYAASAVDTDPMPGLNDDADLAADREFTDDEEAFFGKSIEHLLEPEERGSM